MATIRDATVHFGGLTVISDASLSVEPGQKIGLVGRNGVGKSTLLKVLAGIIRPASGNVQIAPGETVAYVPQDYAALDKESVAEYIERRAGLLEIRQRLDAFEGSTPSDESIAQYGDDMDQYQTLGGYEFDSALAKVLDQLGLPDSLLVRRFAELSGGQQVKIGLAAIMLMRFDVQLLDEPTNNLDLAGIELLEAYVRRSPAAMVIISHDRRLLDRTVSSVVEIDSATHTLHHYGLGYDEYRNARAAALAAKFRAYSDYLIRVEELQTAVSKATNAVGKRSSVPKDNDKIAAHFHAQRGNDGAVSAKRRAERNLDGLTPVDEPVREWELRLKFTPARRSSDTVVRLNECRLDLGNFHFGPVSLQIHRGDRVAIVGANGAGKTTLTKLITSHVEPASGTVQLGEGVQIGRVDQDHRLALEHGSALGSLMNEAGLTDEAEARTLLAKFNLGAGEVLRPAAELSPGQRSRLMLAVLMASGANLLVLDEPTNHLDLEALEQLEAALVSYDGTVIVISHDREFLERIGITSELQVVEGEVFTKKDSGR